MNIPAYIQGYLQKMAETDQPNSVARSGISMSPTSTSASKNISSNTSVTGNTKSAQVNRNMFRSIQPTLKTAPASQPPSAIQPKNLQIPFNRSPLNNISQGLFKPMQQAAAQVKLPTQKTITPIKPLTLT